MTKNTILINNLKPGLDCLDLQGALNPKPAVFRYDTLPAKSIGMIGGVGSVGKSYFILEKIILKILIDSNYKAFEFLKKFQNIPMSFNKVYYFTWEESEEFIYLRINNILKTYQLIDSETQLKAICDILQDRLVIFCDKFLYKFQNSKTLKYSTDSDSLIIYDTFSRASNLKSENDNAEVATLINKWLEPIITNNSSMLVIHHLRKDSLSQNNEINPDMIRGASALINNSRYAAILTKRGEDMAYTVVKSNHGKNDVKRLYRGDFWVRGFRPIDELEQIAKTSGRGV